MDEELRMNAIPDYGENFDIWESRGEPTVAVIPARIWDKLPAELRNIDAPIDMMKGSKARLVPIEIFKERFLEAVEDHLDVAAFDRAVETAARDRASRGRVGAEPAI